MKRLVLILLMVVVIACGSTSSGSTSEYIISRETGLYDALDADANQIAILQAGTKIKPALGSSLDCTTFTDGVTMTVCDVKVISSGKRGWVLKNAIR